MIHRLGYLYIYNQVEYNTADLKNQDKDKEVCTVDEKEAARLERNRYMREYRAKNPDKVRAMNKKYWEKRAAKTAREKEDGNVKNSE